jgi:hypothetical protein
MKGGAVTSQMGLLEGFFKCQACEDCPANIISMSDVVDLYPVTYVQGESITVHMGKRDIAFECQDKMYVADFSDWVNDCHEYECVEGNSHDPTELVLMTVQEREALYNKKEVERAREARDFL